MTQVTTYIVLGVLLGIVLGVIFTYLVSLVDPVILSFNYVLIAIIAVVVFILAYIVLVPFANRLGKLNISRELMQDNKYWISLFPEKYKTGVAAHLLFI